MSDLISFMNIDLDSINRGAFLGSPSPNLLGPSQIGYLEVTLNYPRTKGFLNKTSIEQKKIYSRIWHRLKDFLGPNESNFVYENCKSGQIHLHGWIKIQLPKIIPAVMISDCVKTYLKLLPTKYNTFKEANYYPQYRRFRCPSICCQYSDNIDEWKTYMTKQQ